MKYFILALFLSISLYSSSLFAGMTGFSLCPRKNLIILPGLGYSHFNDKSLAGLELSAVYTTDCFWMGGYIDHYSDFNQIQKSSAGVEFGWAAFGLDLGFMHYQNHQDSWNGFRIRPIFSIHFISFYLGGAFSKDEAYLDTGVLLKLPFCFTYSKKLSLRCMN